MNPSPPDAVPRNDLTSVMLVRGPHFRIFDTRPCSRCHPSFEMIVPTILRCGVVRTSFFPEAVIPASIKHAKKRLNVVAYS